VSIHNPSGNRVFVNDSSDPISDSLILPSTSPINIYFVFPKNKKPVEVLTIRPAPVSAEQRPVPQSPDREEKRARREIRTLEKRNSEWEKSYSDEIALLMETENSILREIASQEQSVQSKRKSVESLKALISTNESSLAEKDAILVSGLEKLKAEHLIRHAELTHRVNSAADRIATLTEEKSKLQAQYMNQ
jgi:uncharacterized protein YeeX (DUF496 family)